VAIVETVESETALIEALPDAVALFGRDFRLASFNRGFADLWALDRAWLDAAPDFGTVLEKLRAERKLPEQRDFAAFRAALSARFSAGGPEEQQWHLPDGRSLKVVTAPRAGGGLVAVFQDLTNTLALRRSYNEGLAVQRATIDHVGVALAAFGSDGRLKLHNPAFAALWSGGEAPIGDGLHVAAFVDATRRHFPGIGDWPTYRDELVGRLLGRAGGGERIRRADGRVLDFAHRPLPDGAVLVSFTDVTDGARIEDALRERAGALEAADRLKSEFLAKVGYEIRTPLESIGANAELLAGDYFGSLTVRQKEYADGIAQLAARLSALVADVLDLANIEAGLLELDLDTVDLHAVLASVLGLVRGRAERKKLALEFDCPPDIGWISADERRLKQILFHLLNNAETFTPAAGTVSLKARRKGGEIAITVSDTGPGIPKADRERVFRGFERGDPAGENAGERGAGLGLTLVRSFVELHGGRIEIAARPGRGTRVTFALPAAS
jgi:signal transduction histidine kinase